jgi:hypothetical protein
MMVMIGRGVEWAKSSTSMADTRMPKGLSSLRSTAFRASAACFEMQ